MNVNSPSSNEEVPAIAPVNFNRALASQPWLVESKCLVCVIAETFARYLELETVYETSDALSFILGNNNFQDPVIKKCNRLFGKPL